MITDNIENAQYYYCLGKNFQKGFEFLQNTDLLSLDNGKYEIEGENIFVSIQDYYTKTESEGKFEAHKKYADIQFVIKGSEKLGFTNIKSCKPITEFDEEKDIIFFDGEGDFIKAKAGTFLIFMPQDAHLPCISIDKPHYVKKAVVKVKLS